jgi:hypothetical protein
MKFLIILFIIKFINILCNSNNYQIYYKSQLKNLFEENNKYIHDDTEFNRIYTFNNIKENHNTYNIKSLISSILLKLKIVFHDINISTQLCKNIINNYNRLMCDDDINNIYTLFW